VTADNQSARFEEAVLPHLDAAFNLARWLVRNSTDAQDLVQEAYLRAWKGFAGFHGGDARPWILTIVRNTCYTWLRKYSRRDLTVEFDEGVHTQESSVPNPERMFNENANREVASRPCKICRPSSGNRLCFGNLKDCPTKRSARLLVCL
jgi:RNA polymerase sigma factor (sigma-70 family)